MAAMGYSAEDELMITREFEELLARCKRICKREGDEELITRAFELAKLAHKGVKRRSGEPYIMHPLAIARHLGSSDNVTSPTFAIVNSYDTDSGGIIYHFDFYRLNRPEEAFDIGYEEYFFSGELCLIEWPEKIEPLLPEETLKVHISVTGDNSRLLSIDTE